MSKIDIRKNAISLENLPKKLMPNMVLIKPKELLTSETESGLLLIADEEGAYEDSSKQIITPSEHAPREGEVIDVCDKLSFNPEFLGTMDQGGSLSWDTTIEITKGDTVFYSYYDAVFSPSIVVDDEVFIIMKYDALYFNKTTNHPLNGYILFKDISNDEKIGNIIIPDLYNKSKGGVGEAILIGTPNTNYMFKGLSDDIEINKTDICFFYGNTWDLKIYMESQIHQSLNHRYFVAQRSKVGFIQSLHKSI